MRNRNIQSFLETSLPKNISHGLRIQYVTTHAFGLEPAIRISPEEVNVAVEWYMRAIFEVGMRVLKRFPLAASGS